MSDEKSIVAHVAAWAAGQPFTNILLSALLVGFGWMAWHCVTIAVPQHLEAIQNGYEKLDTAHRSERQHLQQSSEKWLEKFMAIGHPEVSHIGTTADGKQ